MPKASSIPATSAPSTATAICNITDRSKDVIKSGGEWISSIELENLAVGHPKVAEAAVIGVRHPKWDERPLLVVVLKQGQSATRTEMLAFLEGKVAKWWMPDDVVFVAEIPHTATGKIQKTALRERFKDYVLPDRRGVMIYLTFGESCRGFSGGKRCARRSMPDRACGAGWATICRAGFP